MSRRLRLKLLLRHWIDGLLVVMFAGTLAAFFHAQVAHLLEPGVSFIASLGQLGIYVMTVVLSCCVAMVFPGRVASLLRAATRFPWHLGILIKVAIALGVYVAWAEVGLGPFTAKVDCLALGGTLCAAGLGLCLGFRLATYITAPTRWEQRRGAGQEGAARDRKDQSRTTDPGLGAWLVADRPVLTKSENRIPAHERTAERILSRLLADAHGESGFLPSVALIGRYGSGKTSICNLVEDRYKTDAWPQRTRVLFCRFEGWQYLTPEAAVHGLVTAISGQLECLVDTPALWALSGMYSALAKGTSGLWWAAAGLLFGAAHTPVQVLSRIGENLIRLNTRLVVFVDDFDRVEVQSSMAKEAVAQALNQLQNVPNVQYVITVGRTSGPELPRGATPTTDLLKLTRYQEQVPRLEPAVTLSLVRQLRDAAIADELLLRPWTIEDKGETDPLEWSELSRFFGLTGVAEILAELLNTPRALKAALRETKASWDMGLSGEINWYDLVLANALRAAEPTVFEWVERDRETFLQERYHGSDDLLKERASQLEQILSSCVRSHTGKRLDVVRKALVRLFPRFGSALKAQKRADNGTGAAYQRLGAYSTLSCAYFDRFLTGCVPLGDVPDKPTLEHVGMLRLRGFRREEFEQRYLSSLEKLSGPLNKVVQFAKFIPCERVLEVCDAVVDWAAVPEQARLWPEPARFATELLLYSRRILYAHQDALDIAGWAKAKVEQYGRSAPLVAIELLHILIPDRRADLALVHNNEAAELVLELARGLRKPFVEEDEPLLLATGDDRWALHRFVLALQRHPEYADFRSRLTSKLVSQADDDPTGELKARIGFALVRGHRAVSGKPPKPEDYELLVDKDGNEQRYDMTILVPALARWREAATWDPVASRVFDFLSVEYGLGEPNATAT